ncbi:16S rRNA (adenine(1518)-N(6)/adenine(1519)-N(6))-dimethyltransferase RsmA [Trichothermofontia sp.]
MPSPPARKRFAQHWLRSETALNQIIQAANLSPDDRILEIGPGTGILTRQLLPLVAAVVAIEIDRDLCQRLVKHLGDRENFLLLTGDVLSWDWPTRLTDFPHFQAPNKVVANIPYNITGPILEQLLGTIAQPNPTPFERIVLLVQKEVADRLCAQPGSKNFGALSVRVQYLAQCETVALVPACAFHPKPKVDSAIVCLQPQMPIRLAADNPLFLDRLVRLGFASKRKMLRNNLEGVVDRAILLRAFADLGINPQVRAEAVSVAQWVALSNDLQRRLAHPDRPGGLPIASVPQ